MSEITIDYYNKESTEYTAKRYPSITKSFIQYMFKQRLALLLSSIKRIEKKLSPDATILDIGCADGVIFKAIENVFPEKFIELIGMDISPEMIEIAKKQSNNRRTQFYLKSELPDLKFDVVVELGVHPYDLEKELIYASNHLKKGGYFFYSVAGKNSLYLRRNMREKTFVEEYNKREPYIDDYKTYKTYQFLFNKYFSIVSSSGYGLFVPKLWKFPKIARLLQPFFDNISNLFFPEFSHEKIYFLKKKKLTKF